MRFDPYLWSKGKLKEFIEKIAKIKHNEVSTSPGDIWSIRKFYILDYCIDGFVPIFRKYFDKWYYVDTHCGTGLIGFKEKELHKERFPGTPLVAAFRSQGRRFSKYYFSDNDRNATDALETRLNALKSDIPDCSYQVDTRDFAKTVEFLKQLKGRNGFFIVIDPIGYVEIKWELMESLLKIRTADIFFNFMTLAIARNSKTGREEGSLNQFYGNNEWKSCINGNELMELYKRQIEKHRKYVYTIPVGKSEDSIMYHIIVATNSSGANNVVKSAMKIAEVETRMINGGLKVVTGKDSDMDQFL